MNAILEGWGVSTGVAEPLAYVLVIGAITYLSVIIGELVPKNFALKNPEGIACAVAPLMRLISRLAAPVVWVLDASTKLIFRLLGVSTESASAVTDEEIRTIVAEAETAGVIETDERKMISGVMRLADRAVRGIMTPRTDVAWIDLDHDELEIKEALTRTQHSRLPVCEGGPDNMIGVVQVESWFHASSRASPSRQGAHPHRTGDTGHPGRARCAERSTRGRGADGART